MYLTIPYIDMVVALNNDSPVSIILYQDTPRYDHRMVLLIGAEKRKGASIGPQRGSGRVTCIRLLCHCSLSAVSS